MVPTFIGYFPKRTEKRPDWLSAAGVEEVCSMADCVSSGPDGWLNHWRHNEMWVYDTPALAWSVVPSETRGEFDLYAYFLFPLHFVEGREEPFQIPALNPAPLDASFHRLGYDLVSRWANSTFEHSPLSCNHLAEEIPVNRFCLIDDAQTVLRLASEVEAMGAEPGPYHVVEVWRQTRCSVESA
ncbi:MAG: hypothetical protein EOP84_07430 [Verrucomicrobiaceae bacterium]|nr:MAG: hypothetical protein EOP84_07430 [Verrucomicrobiaceae bacterium]